MKALIVDDSTFLRQFLRKHLGAFGITCTEAGQGEEALEILSSGAEFDLMLVDVNMPIMNGLECVKRTREQRIAPDMKVMMVTTEMDDSFILRALDYGADEFLMKPFTAQSLREKLVLMGIKIAA